MVKYNQEQAEIVNKYLSETLIHKLSDLLDFTDVCDGEDLGKDHRRTGDKNLGGLTPFCPKTIFY